MKEIDFYSKLTQIDQAVTLGTTLKLSWFRGHPGTYGNLTPSAFRSESRASIVGGWEEREYAERFKRQAPAFSDYTPEDLDHLEWLFMMQHHGAPTRLLDWTENLLVALYFAVKDEFSKDGEIWAIYPHALNQESIGKLGISLPRSSYIQYLAGEPFHKNPKQLRNELELKKQIKGPLPLYPPTRFQRMINQLSVFTIHPDPKHASTITDLLLEPKDIVRYLIPKNCKQGLLSELHTLGIRESTLFPNLDSLSTSIIQEMKIVGYTPPEPPVFAKESGDEKE